MVKELKEVGNIAAENYLYCKVNLRHAPRNPVIYLISCRNTQEDSLSILVKFQSASLVRQLLQTKDKFPLQNHYATLQHKSIKNSTCLFLGLMFTKPVVSRIFFL